MAHTPPAFSIIASERRVRECARCRDLWPLAFEYCRTCAIWIGDSERTVSDTWLVPEPAFVATRAPGLPPRQAGRPVIFLSTFLDCRLSPGYQPPLENLAERLDRLIRVVAAQGGQPFAWPGQGLLVTFGWPGTTAFDPVRALRGAFVLWREAGRVLGEACPGAGGIEVRMGLNIGLALTTGREAGLPLEGESLDVARRLARSAPPGTALCSPAVFAHGKRFFAFVGTGNPLWPEGQLPRPTFALLDERAATSHLHVDPLDRTPLVGRSEELDQLLAALERARHGRTEVVSLIAEPGMEKSKLIFDVLRRLDAAGILSQITLLRGFGASYGGGPYGLLRGLLASLPGGAERPAHRLEGVGRALDPSHRRTLEALWTATTPGPAEVAAALQGLFRALATGRPLLVVLDDLHWADDDSLAVLGHIVGHIRDIRLLLLFSYRPSGAVRVRWSPEAHGHVMRLAPLTGATAQAFLSRLVDLDTLSPADATPLLTRTRGNPLHLEEALALLGERGRAQRRNGRWVIAAPHEATGVPLAEPPRAPQGPAGVRIHDAALDEPVEEVHLAVGERLRRTRPEGGRLTQRTGCRGVSSPDTHVLSPALTGRWVRAIRSHPRASQPKKRLLAALTSRPGVISFVAVRGRSAPRAALHRPTGAHLSTSL